jgi:hypothetical protein
MTFGLAMIISTKLFRVRVNQHETRFGSRVKSVEALLSEPLSVSGSSRLLVVETLSLSPTRIEKARS